MMRFGIVFGAALVLAGCQSTGTAPPSGYLFESDNAGLVSSSERVDPVTGMTVTTSTAWHQGREPEAPLRAEAMVGRWSLAEVNGPLRCGWVFELTKLVLNPGGDGMKAARSGSCHLEFTGVYGWYVHGRVLVLTDARSVARGTLQEQPDGSFAGSYTAQEGKIVQIVMRRG